MTITTQSGLAAALDLGTKQRFTISKTATVSTTTGQQGSYWRTAGINPAQGAVPTTAAVCTNATVGGIPFANPASGLTTHLAKWSMLSSLANGIELHDRLAHMGGLDTTLTTAQTVNIDLSTLASAGNNLATRRGKSDYSEVQWNLEFYTTIGSTATGTTTVTYVDQNGTTQTTTVTIPASTAAGKLIPIIPTIANNFIRGITSVQFGVASGTAGNVGVTASVERTSLPILIPATMFDYITGPVAITVPDYACLTFIGNGTTTTVGTIGGTITLAQG